MMANVPSTTTTIGAIADSKTNLHGQANTRAYSDAEKAQTIRNRQEFNKTAAGWSNSQLNGILGIGTTTPDSKLPESEA